MEKYHHLTREQRYMIHELLESNFSKNDIAALVGVHRSTIYREIERNSSKNNGYNWIGAQRSADMGRQHNRIDLNRKIKGWLEQAVVEKLKLGWSPEQISNRLKLEGKGSVSHEAIYRYIHWDRELGGGLYKNLRYKGKKRKSYRKGKRFIDKDEARTSIDKRPKKVEKREEIGHWERDLIVSPGNAGANLLTLNERKSRFTVIKKTKSKSPDETYKEMKKFIAEYKEYLETMTNDNGFEFRDFKKIEADGVPVYFCHPYTSSERGTIENTNGLIRQFIPKGTVISKVTEEEIEYIESILNDRPRALLNYKTPREVLFGNSNKLFNSKKYYDNLYCEAIKSLWSETLSYFR